MSKLRLGPVLTEKPVKLTVELPAALHRDLTLYAEILAREAGQEKTVVSPASLVAPMLEKFIAADRVFIKIRQAAMQQDRSRKNEA